MKALLLIFLIAIVACEEPIESIVRCFLKDDKMFSLLEEIIKKMEKKDFMSCIAIFTKNKKLFVEHYQKCSGKKLSFIE